MRAPLAMVFTLVSLIATGNPKIYLAGQYKHGRERTACYWVDGSRFDLSAGSSAARATSIYVFQGRVYVAGFYEKEKRTIACYWIDGVRSDLPGGEEAGSIQDAWAFSISVSAGKVYVAGYSTGHKSSACYWVDGVRNQLPGSSANSIYVLEGKVYVAGENDGKACYWVNGETRVLVAAQDVEAAAANAIALSTGNVFIAGNYRIGKKWYACYWLNGARTDLVVESRVSPSAVAVQRAATYATSMWVCDGNIYIAGYYEDGVDARACYWINGKRIDIRSSSTQEITLSSIFALKNTFYIAGWIDWDQGYSTDGCYWKDGTRIDLRQIGATVDAIFVVQ